MYKETNRKQELSNSAVAQIKLHFCNFAEIDPGQIAKEPDFLIGPIIFRILIPGEQMLPTTS